MSRYAIMNQENGYVHGPFEATNYLAARQAFADKYGHKDYEELAAAIAEVWEERRPQVYLDLFEAARMLVAGACNGH